MASRRDRDASSTRPVFAGVRSQSVRSTPTCPFEAESRESAEQAIHELAAVDAEVFGDLVQYCRKRADPQGVAVGDRDMMLTALLGGEPKMAPTLASDAVPQGLEEAGDVPARAIPRQPHAAMTSSRT